MQKLIDKKTEELEKKLLSSKQFHMLSYDKQDPIAELRTYLKENGYTNKQLATQIGVSESLVSKMLSGDRLKRDNLLKIGIVSNMKTEVINQILKYLSLHPLYVKDRRDAVIIHGIETGKSLEQINATLAEHNITLL